MHRIGRTLGLIAGLASAVALAAGSDGSWSHCGRPARLMPDPAGRTSYVATWGSNPSSCPGWSGYTFRTIDAAIRCARGKDTIYVHGGTYGPFSVTNFWPSDRVLVTNVNGENPVIDGWSSVGDYQAIVWLWNVSNLAFQGLTIQNTGVPDANHGGYGFKVDGGSHVQLYYSTIQNTARHGVVMDGNSHEVVGNEIQYTVLRNRWKNSNYWDAGFASGGKHQQWGLKFVGNSVHDSWGECVDVLALDGATVEGNRVYSCLSGNIYISNSRNVTVNRNWVFTKTDAYNKPNQPYREAGITIANEGRDDGFRLSNIRVTNNIVEGVLQAFRFWRSHSGSSIQDTYGNVFVAFNTFNKTQTWPVRLDATEGNPQGWNVIRQNVIVNTSGWDWYSNENGNNWEVAKNYNYSWGTTATAPGMADVSGGWTGAYELNDNSAVRWVVAPWSESNMPWDDFQCRYRDPANWNPAGASF